jgi:hypothetical protein
MVGTGATVAIGTMIMGEGATTIATVEATVMDAATMMGGVIIVNPA